MKLIFQYFLDIVAQNLTRRRPCHVDVIAGRIFLPNASNEYVVGLGGVFEEVHAPNNWCRGVLEPCSKYREVDKRVANDAVGLSHYVIDHHIGVLYAQGWKSLLFFCRVIRLCPDGSKPVLLVTCHSSFVLMSLWKSVLFTFVAALTAHGIIYLAQRDFDRWNAFVRQMGGHAFHVPNPTDVVRIVPSERVVDQPLTLGFVATIDPRKCQDKIVRAICLLKEKGFYVRGVFAGGVDYPQYKASMVDMADCAGISDRITWLGSVPRKDIPNVLRTIDIYICPSDYEIMPYSILEAMCAGLPVVAHDVGGINEEVLDKKTGFLVRSQDPLAYVDAILLLRSHELREQMGRLGRKHAEECFSYVSFAERMRHVVSFISNSNAK